MGVRGEKIECNRLWKQAGADTPLPLIKEARPSPLRDAEAIKTYYGHERKTHESY